MRPISRRRFLQGSVMTGAALALAPRGWMPGWGSGSSRYAAGRRLRKFAQPLPLPGAGLVVATPSDVDEFSFTQTSITRQLHPDLPGTPVWAYDDGSGLAGQAGSFGMVVPARSGTPLTVRYTSGLQDPYPDWLPVDDRLVPYGDEVRLLTHLHGGFVDGQSDGNPAVAPDGFGWGETQTAYYPNELPHMPASLLWFHDHGMGATRLNVVAGLAAAYVVRDDWDTGDEPNEIGIPGAAYELPLVVQDRLLNRDGTLLYPVSDIDDVTWVGEYFGDTMLVNGKVWPYVDVEPRMYRLRILNGSNARFLGLQLAGLTFWQIGAEGGLWDEPVALQELVLAPAERADVVVDFGPAAGMRLVMRNHRPRAPLSSPAAGLAHVMQFRVGTSVTVPGPSVVPASLPGRRADLPEPTNTRFITLNEVGAETAGWYLNLGGLRFGEDVTETPQVGAVEDWVYINLTEDTHPIHNHLVTFQVVGRTPFDAEGYRAAHGGDDGVPGGIDPGDYVTGDMAPAEPDERGFKDTVKAHPGQLTTIRARFELPAGVSAPQTYVYHCHILEHEDNEMMRPFTVTA